MINIFPNFDFEKMMLSFHWYFPNPKPMILELRACALPFKQWVFHWDSVVRSPHKAPISKVMGLWESTNSPGNGLELQGIWDARGGIHFPPNHDYIGWIKRKRNSESSSNRNFDGIIETKWITYYHQSLSKYWCAWGCFLCFLLLHSFTKVSNSCPVKLVSVVGSLRSFWSVDYWTKIILTWGRWDGYRSTV